MMINDLKILLGIPLEDLSKDELLSLLLRYAENDAKRHCRIDDIEPVKDIVVEMAVYRYNRLGSEGISSESYSGASYAYFDDYPTNIQKSLNAYKQRAVKFY